MRALPLARHRPLDDYVPALETSGVSQEDIPHDVAVPIYSLREDIGLAASGVLPRHEGATRAVRRYGGSELLVGGVAYEQPLFVPAYASALRDPLCVDVPIRVTHILPGDDRPSLVIRCEFRKQLIALQ